MLRAITEKAAPASDTYRAGAASVFLSAVGLEYLDMTHIGSAVSEEYYQID